jgi:hypothetical protein
MTRALSHGNGLASPTTRSPDTTGCCSVSRPPERSDVVALICFALAIFMLCLGRSDVLIAFTVVCALVAGLSPRAQHLVLRAGPTGVDAEIDLRNPELQQRDGLGSPPL